MIKFDCHLHTYPASECSTMDVLDAIDAAIASGLDGVVLTEHDRFWDRGRLEELTDRYRGRIKIFNGIEVSCRQGHFLVFGLKDSARIRFDMPVEELIDLARRDSAAVVVAHPFRFSIDYGQYCYQIDIDGVEVHSSNTSHSAHLMAKKLADQRQLFQLTSSDSHSVSSIGKYHTTFPDNIKSINDLASFIISRKG
ncbi:MAG: PHP domain-containing protein [Nitrospirae bacterium]|nr:PHP domain-containing protein [Nitrospirota bacterium]